MQRCDARAARLPWTSGFKPIFPVFCFRKHRDKENAYERSVLSFRNTYGPPPDIACCLVFRAIRADGPLAVAGPYQNFIKKRFPRMNPSLSKNAFGANWKKSVLR